MSIIVNLRKVVFGKKVHNIYFPVNNGLNISRFNHMIHVISLYDIRLEFDRMIKLKTTEVN